MDRDLLQEVDETLRYAKDAAAPMPVKYRVVVGALASLIVKLRGELLRQQKLIPDDPTGGARSMAP